MSIIIMLFIIGISLSMDALSISLSLGTLNISKWKFVIFCLFVGVLHFIMPVIGSFFGIKIVSFLKINTNILLGIILLFIGIEMMLELKSNNKKINDLNIVSVIVLAFSVSLDSFSTGLGLLAITDKIWLSGFIFSCCSSVFTSIGYIIGKYSSKKLGNYAQYIGILLLIIVGLFHVIKGF